MTRRKCTQCPNHHKYPRKLCPSCHQRDMRRRHPMYYAFDNLRCNSKRRGIPFSLTFEQFKKFAVATDYIQNKGTTKNSYSIDRIKNELGYTVDNIQILTVGANASKGKNKLAFDEELYNRTGEFSMRVHPIKKPGLLGGGRGELLIPRPGTLFIKN